MSSSTDDHTPEPKQREWLCKCFAGMTGTDESLAQFYLQERKWNLKASVNDFMADRKNASQLKKESSDEDESDDQANDAGDEADDTGCESYGDQDESAEDNKAKFASAASSLTVQSKLCKDSRKRKLVDTSLDELDPFGANILRCIVWNIDGLNAKNLDVRMKAIAKIILEQQADVVFLQEVIPPFAEYFLQTLKDYDCICGNDNNYFTATLMKKSRFKMDKSETTFFENTRMGRHYIQINGRVLGSIPICLINTHLESGAESTEERKVQLKQIFKKMASLPPGVSVMCGGDLNLRDKELAAVGGIPSGFEDMWAACGGRKEAMYTWDMTRNDNLCFPGRFKPRTRFDRIYFKRSSPAQLKPVFFGLIGLERLKPNVCFPSDHWGLLCHYQILQISQHQLKSESDI